MGCMKLGRNPTFYSMMFLTTSFFFVEIIVGYMTNSMALVADSFHMLSDIISLFVGFFAMRYSKMTKGDVFTSNTFGWARAEVLGALVNSVFLVALCFSILVEAFKRLVEPEGLNDPDLILIVGGTGLLINVIGMFLFHGHGSAHGHSHGGGGHGHSHGHSHQEEIAHDDVTDFQTPKDKHTNLKSIKGTTVGIHNMSFDADETITPRENHEFVIAVDFQDGNVEEQTDKECKKSKKSKAPQSSQQMNMRGVYLHILGDALGSVIVIIAALIIKYFEGRWTLYVDPGMSIIMVGIILKTSVPLLKESSTILLQHVPSHIQLKTLQEKLLVTFPEIRAVHEFHVWQLTGSRIVASLHVMFTSSDDYNELSTSMKKFFHKEGIHSTTVQPEFIEDEEHLGDENICLLACPDEECAEKVCCKPKKSNSTAPSETGSIRSTGSGRSRNSGGCASPKEESKSRPGSTRSENKSGRNSPDEENARPSSANSQNSFYKQPENDDKNTDSNSESLEVENNDTRIDIQISPRSQTASPDITKSKNSEFEEIQIVVDNNSDEESHL
eukprot:TCONS_00005367-protein